MRVVPKRRLMTGRQLRLRTLRVVVLPCRERLDAAVQLELLTLEVLIELLLLQLGADQSLVIEIGIPTEVLAKEIQVGTNGRTC